MLERNKYVLSTVRASGKRAYRFLEYKNLVLTSMICNHTSQNKILRAITYVILCASENLACFPFACMQLNTI